MNALRFKPANKREDPMAILERNNSKLSGIKLLINECRRKFRIPENINYYSENDYKQAEKKFVKFCLKDGGSHFSLDFK